MTVGYEIYHTKISAQTNFGDGPKFWTQPQDYFDSHDALYTYLNV